MDKDMLLAKAPLPQGWIDMGIGEAAVVREALMSTFRSLKSWSPSRRVDFSYQSPRGLPRLVKTLQSKYLQSVTVTVGAKNGLFLVFKALARMGYKRVVVNPPYWTSFPAIAAEAGVELVINDGLSMPSDVNPSTDVLLVTSPNNPDGTVTSRALVETMRSSVPGLKVIHDAVYETKAYGFNNLEDLGADVKIFSAAKQLGLSGIRVGWVATSWIDLDRHLQDLTETITSGVCVLAQSMVADVLSLMAENPEMEAKFYEESSRALSINREALARGLEGSVPKEELSRLLAKGGMFVWIPSEGLDLTSEVRFVNGDSFGSPGMIRLSIGGASAPDAFLAGQRLGRKKIAL